MVFAALGHASIEKLHILNWVPPFRVHDDQGSEEAYDGNLWLARK